MTRKARRKAAALLTGIVLLGFGGSCIPNNFWYDQYRWTLEATTQAVINAYVITPALDTLQ